MKDQIKIKEIKNIVVRFSGDSGDGMQLVGTLFSSISAMNGNEIATFPDYPSEIRAPQGTLSGVSGYQVHIGSKVFNSGETTGVLIAMNPAALKVNAEHLTKDSIIIVDQDSFTKKDLEKALFATDNPFKELKINKENVVTVPISTLTRTSLEDFNMDNKSKDRCKNMFALGLVCWLFNRSLDEVNDMLSEKFAKRPQIIEANLKVLVNGYNFGQNHDINIPTYRVETVNVEKGHYIDIKGNIATAYGFVAASETSGKPLFLGSYPITPATDILHELSKLKQLGVRTVQAEDEIAAIAMTIGASFSGNLAVTTTSGPGLALKGEAIGLAVMAELPIVVVDVQRGGPSTGLPTKAEQTDLRQALYGRNGESPLVVLAASSPTNCFDMAYWASKLAMEHMTPVILLTDGYIANGSSAWRIPDKNDYPTIKPHTTDKLEGEEWTVGKRDAETFARYWAPAGTEGCTHRLGGLEKDFITGAISTKPENHQKMVNVRQDKINKIADYIPLLEVTGVIDSKTLLVGWGGTHGHLREVLDDALEAKIDIAYTHFNFIQPLPKNTQKVFDQYDRIIVAEQNSGQFAGYLKAQLKNMDKIESYTKVDGQPLSVSEIVEFLTKELK